MAIIHLNQENFTDEVLMSDKPVIIDFWASWCGPCQMMGPVFEKISGEFKNVKFAKVNTQEEPGLAMQFGIQGIPSLLVIKNGKEASRIVGFAPEQILKRKIQDALG